MSEKETKESVCCPRFDPKPWQDQTLHWVNKPFIKGTVRTFWFMPVGFGGEMKRLDAVLREHKAENPDHLCLSEHPSKWRMNLLMAVDRALPGVPGETLNGNFYSRVYEGEYRETGNWMKDFDAHLKKKGLKATRIFMWYTTCPACARKYGVQHTVILAQLT